MRISEIIKNTETTDRNARIVRVRHERSARRQTDALSRLAQAVEEAQTTFGDDPEMKQAVAALTKIIGQMQHRYRGHL